MRINYLEIPPEFSPDRLDWDFKQFVGDPERYDGFWKEVASDPLIPQDRLEKFDHVWLEIGAGTGGFLLELAKRHPDVLCVGIERSRHRGKKLEEKVKKSGLDNVFGIRANAIPALIHGLASKSIDRIYNMYPCPWPKTAQRRNRWYLHPVMPHFLRILKNDGLMLWTSDQKFFIDEAEYVCRKFYNMTTLVNGTLRPNEYNELTSYAGARTAFEKHFFDQNLPSYELIQKKAFKS